MSVFMNQFKVETVLSHFMVGMELTSKNSSLAGQALDMILKLVAPEYGHKMWYVTLLHVFRLFKTLN